MIQFSLPRTWPMPGLLALCFMAAPPVQAGRVKILGPQKRLVAQDRFTFLAVLTPSAAAGGAAAGTEASGAGPVDPGEAAAWKWSLLVGPGTLDEATGEFQVGPVDEETFIIVEAIQTGGGESGFLVVAVTPARWEPKPSAFRPLGGPGPGVEPRVDPLPAPSGGVGGGLRFWPQGISGEAAAELPGRFRPISPSALSPS